MNGIVRSIMMLAMVGVLISCGGGGGDSDGTEGRYTSTGELNVSITDAPVDGATAVWVTITGMKLKRTENENEKTVKLNGADTVANEIQLNLLSLANGGSAALFADSVTSGHYQWIRFDVEKACIAFVANANPNVSSQCIPMDLPAKSELKTSGSFNVPSNGIASITVDWDLRKSIVKTGSNKYQLKPVLHLRDDDQVGALSGLIQGASCDSGEVAAVYVFNGLVTPDDIDDIGVEPFASVKVQNNHQFYVGMLDPGTYTYAYTCDALLDNPATNDAIAFYTAATAKITAGQITSVVYIPVLPPR